MPRADELAHGKRFDQLAERYDQLADQHPIRTEIRRRGVELVIELAPSVVLDLGCGTGETVLELAAHVEFAAGLDVSSEMLSVARRKAAERRIHNVSFAFGSFQDADFRAALPGDFSLDCIIATYSLHHLEAQQQRAALKAMCQALTPHGSLVLGDLMFSEGPANYEDDFERVGYNPANDQPQRVEQLVDIVRSEMADVSVRQIHPLAGILIGTGRRSLA